ncbi:MAG TPA: TatD family hydrolase [Candidatus Saccharimonadales bacterium]
MISLTDTHCHIHEASELLQLNTETKKRYIKAGSPTPEEMLDRAREAGVERLLVVGTTVEDSEIAVAFAAKHDNVWVSIGIHPHEAKMYKDRPDMLARFKTLADHPKVLAVGECGLDYYYGHSPKEDQAQMLRFQIELALKHDLAMVFHVRDAFDDFWSIFDEYKGVRGIIHSFSSDTKSLKNILKRGLYVGLNGIMTFTKDERQLDAAKAVPLDKLVLETDAPFLTPRPFRGSMCEPKHVRITAEFLAQLRGESLETLAARTTSNAQKVLGMR